MNKRYHARQAIRLVRIHMICVAPLASAVVHQLTFAVLDFVVITAIPMIHATVMNALIAFMNSNAAGVPLLEAVTQQ